MVRISSQASQNPKIRLHWDQTGNTISVLDKHWYYGILDLDDLVKT